MMQNLPNHHHQLSPIRLRCKLPSQKNTNYNYHIDITSIISVIYNFFNGGVLTVINIVEYDGI